MININTPVYYINLDVSVARRKNVVQTLKKLGFTNVTRIAGIDTRNEVEKFRFLIERESYEILENDNKAGRRQFFGGLTYGSVGCYLSHLKTYKKILDNMDSNALIFEDDMIIELSRKKFWDRVKKLCMPRDTDVYLLDGTYYDGRREVCKGTFEVGRFTGLYGYFVTKRAAEILIENLFPIKYQIDFQISILMKANLLRLYGYGGRDRLVGHNVFQTTMQNLNCKNCHMIDIDLEAQKLVRGSYFDYNTFIFLIFIIAVIYVV
ncbi:MAG: glycosyl transferase, family 25 [Hyperionvirus sp.]|uniref:Glycosyl transferase, family 25 n=1 Tax=Hyperionvirus sp. TaxID=2487770 RepID=A0A3G5AE94_9VIRU|nr:MAG: glycosyl transferase, family 25 [Hyperionvirus sp.]